MKKNLGSNIPTFIRTRIQRLRQPLDEVQEFEATIDRHTDWNEVSGLPGLPLSVMKFTARAVRLLAIFIDNTMRILPLGRYRDYLCIGYISPHYMIYKTFPYFCLPARTRMIWVYDAWENKLDEIASAFRTHRINLAFVTSKQATDELNRRGIERFAAFWVPEAVTLSDYPSKPLGKRGIDVLHMGRRWNEYHDAIEEFCRDEKLVYLYEKNPGEIIFPTRVEFLDALGNSRISICVPSSITHPARSGRISTMTWRYLQSMAAKCLVVGRTPDEMKELFDYEPMIEVDMNDPCGQLRDILTNFTNYVPLIEKNFDYVKTRHQWPNRIDAIRSAMTDFSKRHSN